MGGITLFGILILIATGIYLAQFYHPDPADAHASVFYITTRAQLGDFVRSLHFWTANLVMATLILHALRVLVTGAYRAPREATWAIGVGLLAVMFGFFFTGTVLKWDQEAWEALQHNEEIGKLLGGLGYWFTTEFSRSTSLLSRVYAAHVSILPVLLTLLVLGHAFLIRRHGIAPLPGEPEAEVKAEIAAAERGEPVKEVSHFTEHIRKIVAAGMLLMAFGAVLSIILAAPLGPPPTPGKEVTKPPWLFLWLYPFENWWGLRSLQWIPIVAFTALLLVPLWDRAKSSSIRARWLLLGSVAIVLLAMISLAIYARLTTPAEHVAE